MEFDLRDYLPEDFRVLWSIDQQCFAPGIAYSQRELSIYIRRRGSFTIVAEVSEGVPKQISGFIVAESVRGAGHVISIDVLPDYRRSGLGSKLLFAAEERLRGSGCRTVVLETAVDNSAALSFYKRHHYSVVKVTPHYYSNGVDALVLSKVLELNEQASRHSG